MLKWQPGRKVIAVHSPRGNAPATLLLCAVLAFAAARAHAAAPLAIVATETLTATREAVRVHLYSIHLDGTLVPTDGVTLPGERIRGSIMLDPQGKALALGTHAGHAGRGGVGESFCSVLSASPMTLGAEGWVVSEPGWQFAAGSLMRGHTSGLVAVSAFAALSSREACAGRIEVRGILQSISTTSITVDGNVFQVTSSTKVEGRNGLPIALSALSRGPHAARGRQHRVHRARSPR